MSKELVLQEQVTVNSRSLFDEYGRRIPFGDMRVFNQVSRRYNFLIQPELDMGKIFARLDQYLGTGGKIARHEFEVTCESILEDVRSNPHMAGLVNGVHVPFICRHKITDIGRGEEIQLFAEAAGRSFEAEVKALFENRCKGYPANQVAISPYSRYEQFETARQTGAVVGYYFANCISEYDVDSQRRQMVTLPEMVGRSHVVLSGGVDAAAAIVGSPTVLVNKESYPHHLCLSALRDPDPRFVYFFEAYDPRLWFNRRSQMLSPTETQVSEAWAGGLTIFRSL